MTDQTNTATEAAARTLNAAEIMFSLDFVIKLAKKVMKDNPAFTPEQVANAIETVFNAKLATAEKRLQNIEKIRAQYNALRGSQDAVVDTAALIKKLGERAHVDYASQVIVAKPGAKAAPKVVNGAAPKAENADQASLPM